MQALSTNDDAKKWEAILASEGMPSELYPERHIRLGWVESWTSPLEQTWAETILSEGDERSRAEAQTTVDGLARCLPPLWQELFTRLARGESQMSLEETMQRAQPNLSVHAARIRSVLREMSKLPPVTDEIIEDFISLASGPRTPRDRVERSLRAYLKNWTASWAALGAGVADRTLREHVLRPIRRGRVPQDHVIAQWVRFIQSVDYRSGDGDQARVRTRTRVPCE